MQIELLETFLDLAETKSFNRTAERLGIAQSAVSGRIKALEKEVGRRLFQRSRAGTSLTTEGLRFEPHALALRHSWVTALNATRDSAMGGVTMRIGIQHDLVGRDIKELITRFRDVLADTAFLFEADYSAQMCNDLVAGAQDIAVLYSPQPQPDLFFETLGEVSYVMLSTDASRLASVPRENYVLANYSAAFARTHAALLPDLTHVSLSIGQNAAMVELLGSMGGAGYVMRHAAGRLVGDGRFQLVADAPVITQPVFAGINLRNRHRATYRQMSRILRRYYDRSAPTRR